MHAQHPDENTPWFSQFWPWFLIALPGSVVIASIWLVFFSFKHADSIVSDNYYKEGLAMNQVVTDLGEAGSMGLTANLALNHGVLTVTLNADQPVELESIDIAFLHPADQLLDHTITAKHLGNQRYMAKLGDIPAGRWYVDVIGKDDNSSWRLKGELVAPFEQVTLKPSHI